MSGQGLPVLSGAELIRVLERAGFEQRRTKGSHASMVRRSPPLCTVTVPLHRELAPGTLRAIIRQAGLSVEELRRLLGR